MNTQKHLLVLSTADNTFLRRAELMHVSSNNVQLLVNLLVRFKFRKRFHTNYVHERTQTTRGKHKNAATHA